MAKKIATKKTQAVVKKVPTESKNELQYEYDNRIKTNAATIISGLLASQQQKPVAFLMQNEGNDLVAFGINLATKIEQMYHTETPEKIKKMVSLFK